MALTHLWDTNIAIYYTDDDLTPEARKIIDQYLETSLPAVSVISELELLGFGKLTEAQFAQMSIFIDSLTVIEIDELIKKETISIRRLKKIKLPDAIIAATAIAYDLTLLSRNEKDFLGIDGLKFVNPFTPLP